MVNAYSPPHGALASNGSLVHRSPRSHIGGGIAAQRSYLQSQHSIDSDNTIQAFLLKDSCGQIVKTQKILEKEHDRVEKVKKARENAVQIAMEKSAKLILKERRYESNVKRHEKLMQEEELYRNEKFATIDEKRKDRRQFTIDHDKHLDKLGIERYHKDKEAIEEHI